MIITELFKNYNAEYEKAKRKADRLTAQEEKLQADIENCQAQIDKIREKRKAIHYPNWIDAVMQPIADSIGRKYPDRDVEVLGPFGIAARVSIHLYKKGVNREKIFSRKNCLSVSLEPRDLRDGELAAVDYSKNTGAYNKGTIGEMNGFNHPTVKVETIADIIKFIK